MKKAVLLSVLLLVAMLFPAISMTEGLSVSTGIEVQLDPVGDVLEIDEDGTQATTSSNPDVDILSFGAEVQEGSGILGQDTFLLTMQVSGSIVDDEDDISYIFIIGTPGDNTFIAFCNYSVNRFTCWVLDIEAGEGAPTLPGDISVAGGTLEVNINPIKIGGASSINSLKAITLDNREDEKYGDQAPDNLIKFTSPSGGAAIWPDGSGMYTFTGACHKSSDDFTNVDVTFGTETKTATTTDGWDTWSVSFDINSLSNGLKTITAVGTAGTETYEDILEFYIEKSYSTASNRPELSSMVGFHVGDLGSYDADASDKINGVDLSSATTNMNIHVEKLESAQTTGGTAYDSYKVVTTESGSLVVGVVEVNQTIERTSWRVADTPATQQTVVREYTHTQQAIEKSGSSLNSIHSYTNITYDEPFDSENLGKSVGDWWLAEASGNQSSKVVEANGDTTRDPDNPDASKTVYNEILRAEDMNLESLGLSTSEEVYLIKNSNGDNETAYTVMSYHEDFPVPVRLQFYDGNRDLLGTMTLSQWIPGTGTHFTIQSIVVPEDIEAGSEATVTVTVLNEGDTAGTAEASLVVDGETVDTGSAENVGPNATATIELSWTPSVEGSYDLQIATQDNALTESGVSVAAEASSPLADNMMIIVLIAIVAIVLVVVLIIAAKRKGDKSTLVDGDTIAVGSPDTGMGIDAPSSGVVVEAATVKPTMSEEQEKKLHDVIGEKTPVKCGKCSATTTVSIVERPFKFKCPECGAKLLIR